MTYLYELSKQIEKRDFGELFFPVANEFYIYRQYAYVVFILQHQKRHTKD